jgi:hypothetical protein
MIRWCPVCESPGKPVIRGDLSLSDIRALQNGSAVRATRDLPGIEPSHFCTKCPTFFRAKDRFYLTALRETAVHGIGVWAHHEPRLRLELGPDGLVALFNDSNSVLIPTDDSSCVFNDFFWGRGQKEIVTWSRRRGFAVRIEPRGLGNAEVQVDPAGPHFVLLVAKSWLRGSWVRTREDLVWSLEDVGAKPIVFRPQEVHS